jgi:hypothetical protein
MSAQAVATVDFHAQAREELEVLLKQISQPATLSHVALGETIAEGARRIGAKAYQSRLDELFERECAEVGGW